MLILGIEIFLVLGLLLAVYSIVVKPNLRRKFYIDQGVKFPKGNTLLMGDYKLFLQYASDFSDAQMLLDTIKKDDDRQMVGYQLAGNFFLNVIDLELAEELLSKVENEIDFPIYVTRMINKIFDKTINLRKIDERWAPGRKAINAAFFPSALKSYDAIFKQCISHNMKDFVAYDGKEIDIMAAYKKILHPIVTSIFLSPDLELIEVDYELIDSPGKFIKLTLSEYVIRLFHDTLMVGVTEKALIFPNIFNSSLIKENIIIRRNAARVEARIKEYVTRIKEIGLEKQFPSALVNLLQSKQNLSEEHIIQESLNFMEGGYDGIVDQTVHLINCLCRRNPGIFDKMREEFKTSLFDGKEPKNEEEVSSLINYEKIQSLQYLNMVYKEITRVCNVGAPVPWEAKKDFKLGKYKIKKGDMVAAPFSVIGRHPKYWMQPEEVIPERFDPESEWAKDPQGNPRDRRAFIPFGYLTKRSCSGIYFVEMAIKYLIVHSEVV